MIPFNSLPGLTFFEILIFEIIQTIIHFIIFEGFLYLGLFLHFKDKSQIDIKNILITGLIVEVVESITAFYSIFYVIGGGIAIIINLFITYAAEFLIIYLRYYEKNKLSLKWVFILFFITFPPAYLISITLTNIIFGLFGIPNAYSISFL